MSPSLFALAILLAGCCLHVRSERVGDDLEDYDDAGDLAESNEERGHENFQAVIDLFLQQFDHQAIHMNRSGEGIPEWVHKELAETRHSIQHAGLLQEDMHSNLSAIEHLEHMLDAQHDLRLAKAKIKDAMTTHAGMPWLWEKMKQARDGALALASMVAAALRSLRDTVVTLLRFLQKLMTIGLDPGSMTVGLGTDFQVPLPCTGIVTRLMLDLTGLLRRGDAVSDQWKQVDESLKEEGPKDDKQDSFFQGLSEMASICEEAGKDVADRTQKPYPVELALIFDFGWEFCVGGLMFPEIELGAGANLGFMECIVHKVRPKVKDKTLQSSASVEKMIEPAERLTEITRQNAELHRSHTCMNGLSVAIFPHLVGIPSVGFDASLLRCGGTLAKMVKSLATKSIAAIKEGKVAQKIKGLFSKFDGETGAVVKGVSDCAPAVDANHDVQGGVDAQHDAHGVHGHDECGHFDIKLALDIHIHLPSPHHHHPSLAFKALLLFGPLKYLKTAVSCALTPLLKKIDSFTAGKMKSVFASSTSPAEMYLSKNQVGTCCIIKPEGWRSREEKPQVLWTLGSECSNSRYPWVIVRHAPNKHVARIQVKAADGSAYTESIDGNDAFEPQIEASYADMKDCETGKGDVVTKDTFLRQMALATIKDNPANNDLILQVPDFGQNIRHALFGHWFRDDTHVFVSFEYAPTVPPSQYCCCDAQMKCTLTAAGKQGPATCGSQQMPLLKSSTGSNDFHWPEEKEDCKVSGAAFGVWMPQYQQPDYKSGLPPSMIPTLVSAAPQKAEEAEETLMAEVEKPDDGSGLPSSMSPTSVAAAPQKAEEAEETLMAEVEKPDDGSGLPPSMSPTSVAAAPQQAKEAEETLMAEVEKPDDGSGLPPSMNPTSVAAAPQKAEEADETLMAEVGKPDHDSGLPPSMSPTLVADAPQQAKEAEETQMAEVGKSDYDSGLPPSMSPTSVAAAPQAEKAKETLMAEVSKVTL